MAGLLFHFGFFFPLSLDRCFQGFHHPKGAALQSLCIHVLVSIRKPMTICTSTALAGFRFPVHLKQTELLAYNWTEILAFLSSAYFH